MAFWKSKTPRFQERISCAPPPTKYAPHNKNQVKGHVPYDKQKTSRFLDAEHERNSKSRSNQIRVKSRSKNLLEDELKTAKQNLRDMEQMFCESEITIAQLLTENKELEELLQMQDEFYSKAVGLQMNKSAEEKVIKLRKQKRELELRKSAETQRKPREEHMMEMKGKSRKFHEMAGETSNTITGEESKYSKQEADLRNELRVTKLQLQSARGEEKAKFKETIARVTEKNEAILKEMCKDYNAKMTKKDTELKQLQKEVKKLTFQLSSTQEQNDLLRKYVKEQAQQINTQVDNSNLNTEMQGQVSELEQQVFDQQVKLTNVIKKHEELQKVLNKKEMDIKQKMSIINEQYEELEDQDDMIASLKSQLQEKDHKIATLQKQMDEQNTYAKKFQKYLYQKQMGNEQRNCLISDTSYELNELLKTHMEEQDTHEKKLLDLQASLTEVIKKNEELQEDVNKKEMGIKQMERVINELKSELDNMKDVNGSLKLALGHKYSALQNTSGDTCKEGEK
ncbi:CAP-Gly domain-containing linker protein 1-like isoform X2 [Zootermopsis nevadensis]|uniref:Uncharacterized protein n=1 Tax=Zootermopsis nevadensis TaxID=136037 RepID=A0A067RBX7_ZOONE|nr:CAP-Gly domain-containing linker protein 1-like isoform X2 [Zootermopsis nevadensis]KDR20368.1 hypothetical protein L798_05426 [Zootermopsis nevadensis]